MAQRKDGGISLSVDYTIPLTLNTTFRRQIFCEYQCRESAWPNFCIRDYNNIDTSILCTYLSICTRLDICKMSHKQINKLFKINKSETKIL